MGFKCGIRLFYGSGVTKEHFRKRKLTFLSLGKPGERHRLSKEENEQFEREVGVGNTVRGIRTTRTLFFEVRYGVLLSDAVTPRNRSEIVRPLPTSSHYGVNKWQ